MKKTVLITGASRGIGKAAALRFAKESANTCHFNEDNCGKDGCDAHICDKKTHDADSYNLVITCNKNTQMLEDVKNAVTSFGCPCLAYTGDLSSSSNVKQLAGLTAKEFGSVDILINNAGVSYVGLLTDMSDNDWNNIINTNLSSVFYCCREFVPSMVRNKSGCIINISSIWGSLGASCEVAYSASKGAVNAFTRALAKELAPSSVSVNAVACGLIDTDMNSVFSADELVSICEDIPCGRAGTPDEAAGLIYSVSRQTPYMTGQIITIDGGWS
ncbi:MAG: SDR family NAD(P)-dependent oxidoreductase [Lachnospiraceae bacterium]|nr:SDR family NAD(P)-dependent oxidoreductase [Lachnospiraceae bacterium]